MRTAVGIAQFGSELTVAPGDIARDIEERGFESFFVPDHTHIPTSREVAYRLGGELPEHYRRLNDPLVALGAAAAMTSRIKLGTGICLVAQRDAIATAKALATIDSISGGRLICGIGTGWNTDEMRNHGLDPGDKWAVLEEKTAAMTALWTDDVAEFDGAHVRFSPSWAWPKPVEGRPPVLLGSRAGEIAFDHVVRYCDGWMPIGDQEGFGRKADLASQLARLNAYAEDRGRDPASIRISLMSATLSPAHLDQYSELGIERAIAYLPSVDRSQCLRVLDQWAALL